MPPSLTSRSKASPPCLRFQRRTKNFFVRIPRRFGGGTKWFGSNEEAARAAWTAWGALYQRQAESALPSAAPSRPRTRSALPLTDPTPFRGGMPRVGPQPMTVRAVAASLFALVDSESGPAGRQKVRLCTNRFLNLYGDRLVHELTAADLVAFKASLAALKPTSKNDLLTYARRLLTHAWDIEAIEDPFRLKVLANVKRGALPDKAMKPSAVRDLIATIYKVHPSLARICLLQFYIVGRPSEAPKALYAERFGGVWEADGVLAVVGKGTRKSGEPRRLLFSEPALTLLREVGKPTWKRGDGAQFPLCPNGLAYGQFARRIGEKIKHQVQQLTGKESLSVWAFRHASNQALLDAGVSEEDARKAAGHVRDRVRRAYGVRENYTQTRQALRVLAELVPLETVGIRS